MVQGPAPPKKNTYIIPLISTYTSNFSNSMVIEVTKQLIKNTKDEITIYELIGELISISI